MIIENFPNYEIFDNGQIFDIKNQKWCTQFNYNGYLGVCLSNDKERKKFYVHRLVAQTFIPNPNNLPQVNHKDENKQNNHVSNLEWCTSKYNNNYGTRTQRMVETRKKDGYNISQESAIQVIMIDKSTLQELQIFPSIKEAGRFLHTSPSHINEAAHGKRKSAGGYYWKIMEK